MAKTCGDDARNWAALADFASDLSYADWRNEILSFLLYAPDPRSRRPVVTPLRKAV
jgi:hypothetical protein